MPLKKLPTVDLDNVNHRRRARETINQVLDHSFDDSRVQTTAEKLAGVTPVNAAYAPEDARRFGAIADGDGAGGGTNNYSALSNWLLANAGRDVTLPPGVYRCDTGLVVPTDTFITATAATLDFKNTSNLKGLVFTQRGGIYQGKILGPTSGYSAGQMGLSCQGTNHTPLAPTFVDGPTIIETEIANWGQYGCYWAYLDAPTLDKVYIHDCGYAANGGVSINDGALTNALIEDIGPGVSDDAYGCFWDRLSDTELVDPRSFRCIIQGCTIKNVISGTGTNGQAMDSHAGVDMVYSGNTIINCNVGCAFVGSSIAGVPTLGPIRCQEYGNVYNLTSHQGYGVIVAGPYSGGVLQAPAVDCVVGPSIMEGGGIAADSITGAYQLQGTKNCTVKIGVLKNPRCNGVLILLDNVGFNVSGGTILDPYDSSVNTAACVAVRGDNNQGYIGGITFQYANGGLGTYVAVHCIRINAGLASLGIEMGRCAFVGIDATHLSYSEGTSSGVNADGLYRERGRAALTLTSATANTTFSVSFSKRMPSATPRISMSIAGGIANGGKTVSLRTNNVSATGFDIIAYPYDLLTYTATGSLDIDWTATT